MRRRLLLLPLSGLFILFAAMDADARLFRADNGDCRLIGVPLMRQTGRSDCAPATMAAVLNYAGIPADARKIAADSGSTDATGTDVEAMLGIVASTCAQRGLVIESLVGFDYARYRRIILAYNDLARKAGAKRLWFADRGHLDLAKTFADADIVLLRRVMRRREREAFRRAVQTGIDADAPLIWGVVLGIAPEPELAPYSHGGHLRLIIGYNAKTREILYADPWGPGHQLKRMALDDAHAITMSLHRLKPAQPGRKR